MKAKGKLSNILWLIGLVLISVIIAGKMDIISLPIISINPYQPTTPAQLNASDTYSNISFCIGYIFIIVSIIIKICGTISRKKIENNKNVNKKLSNYLGLLCKIITVIFTIIIFLLSLFMMFLSLIDFSDIPQ